MLVTEANRSSDRRLRLRPNLAQAAKTEPDKNHGPRPLTVHGSLIGIIEREIMRSVGLGNSPEPTTGGIEGPARARSRNAHQG